MSDGDEILARVRPVVVRIAGPVEVTPETRLVRDLALESVQILELVGDVERAFGIALDRCDVEPIVTVADLVAAIAIRTGSR